MKFYYILLIRALKDSDLIVLLGARLNWMLHFGKSPRFSENVKIVQVEISFLKELKFS
jgi:thiamine pyrophosphate-dependent acetolactate synthase large subunit-like protein